MLQAGIYKYLFFKILRDRIIHINMKRTLLKRLISLIKMGDGMLNRIHYMKLFFRLRIGIACKRVLKPPQLSIRITAKCLNDPTR